VSSLFDLPFEEPEPEPPVPLPQPVRRVWTVGELTASVRDLLETRFADLWIEGELSNARVWTTGHLYFTLKDESAQIKGVMFRSALRYLRFSPQDGLHVIVRGRVSVYDPKGEYQIVAEHMEPRGHGALQLAFEQLKKKLAAEGLFDAARKRPLPSLPRRIGVVTSIDGAALRDIVRVLRRRYPNAHLVIAPSKVQGEDASGEIVRGLRLLGRIDGVDVIIVARGGGSLEDLWAFNEERVARAIAAARVPVISAVGHETDFTIADFVADLRAPTPSAAAELVVRRKDEFCGHIDRLSERLGADLLALDPPSQDFADGWPCADGTSPSSARRSIERSLRHSLGGCEGRRRCAGRSTSSIRDTDWVRFARGWSHRMAGSVRRSPPDVILPNHDSARRQPDWKG
jgi:exodeoxyribonuclease VII large subunit